MKLAHGDSAGQKLYCYVCVTTSFAGLHVKPLGCIVPCNDSTSYDINWQNHPDRRAFLELTLRLHAPAV